MIILMFSTGADTKVLAAPANPPHSRYCLNERVSQFFIIELAIMKRLAISFAQNWIDTQAAIPESGESVPRYL